MTRGPDLNFTVRAGLALADGHSGASSTLMAAADEAMYRAKADGGDRYVVAEIGPQPATSRPDPIRVDPM